VGPGVAYTASAAGSLGLALWVGVDDAASDPWPRRGRDQFAYEAAHAYQSIAFLSAWDAFHRAIPGLQMAGKYEFLPSRESLGDLLTAPFDVEFLRRPTTWAHLAYTGLVAALVVGGREPGVDYEPFQLHDAAFATSLSYNAAVSEERSSAAGCSRSSIRTWGNVSGCRTRSRRGSSASCTSARRVRTR